MQMPDSLPLVELRYIAGLFEVEGRWRMTKAELLEALEYTAFDPRSLELHTFRWPNDAQKNPEGDRCTWCRRPYRRHNSPVPSTGELSEK